MKTVSLVLGSGGARGLAHIGVIRWLEANNYQIRSIVGCSIGAVIGGIYAAGKLDVYEQWVRSVTKLDIITLLDLSWDKSGLVRGDKLINTLIKLVGEQLIEDLPLAYTAVATDIKSQKEVWLRSGSLFDAMRASFAIPLLFTPFRYKGGELVDGGVLNPVPIAPTFGDDTDITIAVNLGGDAQHTVIQTSDSGAAVSAASPLRAGINRFTAKLQQSVTHTGSGDWGAYDIAMQAFDTMQSTIARQKLAAYPPDIVIEIARNACNTLEFDRAALMIELGYQRAGECLSHVEMQEQ